MKKAHDKIAEGLGEVLSDVRSYESAWNEANDAWIAAGRATPCFDPAYLRARERLHGVARRLGLMEDADNKTEGRA